MSSIKTTFEQLVCDRCGKKSMTYNPMHGPPAGWKEIVPNVGRSGRQDVCPNCWDEFNLWWVKGEKAGRKGGDGVVVKE